MTRQPFLEFAPFAVGGGIIISLIALVLGIVIWWKIFAKTGYSGVLGLLMLVPLVNLIMLLVLAFGEWPIERELRQLRELNGRRAV